MGRYESSKPPSGDTLLRLAEIARAHEQPQIAERFLKLYGREVAEKLGGAAGFVTFRFSRQLGDDGLLFEPLHTPEEYAYAEAFQLALKGLREKETRARNALQKLFNTMAEAMPPGESEFHRRNMETK